MMEPIEHREYEAEGIRINKSAIIFLTLSQAIAELNHGMRRAVGTVVLGKIGFRRLVCCIM